MTKDEAYKETLEGLWYKLPSIVTSEIVDACNSGEFEITVEKHILSQEDIKILGLLGYRVTYDDDSTNSFYPIYIINWK